MHFLSYLEPKFLIETAGLLGVFFIIFAESGLFFGFFLPGDSLLFTAGFLASQGYFSISILVGGAVLAAIVGDTAGYAFGRKVGPKIFSRDDSLFFHKKHVVRAQRFYANHGNKTIILARFIPVVRTFAPILAGVGAMSYGTFLKYNCIGGFLWAAGIPLVGYLLGGAIPGVDQYLLPIIIMIVVLSVLPGAFHFYRSRKTEDL
ncbi:MAG TPA: VTT domain-containing protein [Candidatus Paceibacterota bacterium]